MPSDSTGFCVAMTRNGLGSWYVVPSMVTRPSCIASSRAACVLAGARLISSASTSCANTGPGRKNRVVRAHVERGVSRDVAGQHVGRELDAGEPESRRLRERTGSERLGHAGHVVEQHVAARQQAGEHEAELRALADHGALDLVEEQVDGGARGSRQVGRAGRRWRGGTGWRRDGSCGHLRCSRSRRADGGGRSGAVVREAPVGRAGRPDQGGHTPRAWRGAAAGSRADGSGRGG